MIIIKKLLLIVFLILVQTVVFGQTVGDYRSNVNTTGTWDNSSSWEYYNGSSWVPATNYPGQIAGTYAILIQVGDFITMGVPGITTQTMGTLTINGSLVLTGIGTGSIGTNFVFNTQTIIVTPLLGTIKFIDKVNLKLPTNATLQVTTDTTPDPDYFGLIGDCNHNQDIYIGTNVYAYCNGGGTTGLTFIEVMNGGGTLNAIASSNIPCVGDTINLFGNYTGVQGATIAYSWSITNPSGGITTTTTRNPTVSNAVSGTYTATLTCSTTYNGNPYSNTETIYVIVNSKPAITTQPIVPSTTCSGSGTQTITVIATGTGLTYSWRKGGVAVANGGAISGQGTAALTLTNPTASDAGSYDVVVSGTCTPEVTSNAVTVTVSNAVDWANLQFPSSANICEGGSIIAYGQVWKAGVTPGVGLQGAGITVEFGYATSNTDPNTWTNWFGASFNGSNGDNNNDEYQYTFAPPSSGTYYYTFRYRSGTCNWQYGGTGGFWNGSTSINGVLTVNPASVGGMISGGTTICSGSTSGLLTLSGQTGTITKWQSSVSPFSTWTDIANTATTYTSGALSATTQFRAEVQSGVCSVVTSGTVTVTVTNPVDWANLQFPPSGNICEGGSLTAFGQVHQAGVTEGYNSQGAGITVEFGYSTSNSNPNTWTNWTAASFNGLGGGTQNDEYQYIFSPPSSGTYYYTFRYRSGFCNWRYGGYVLNAGGFWDGTTNVNGVLTVYPMPTAPSVGIPIQPTCTLATGTITVAVQNAGETYSFDDGATFQASNTKSLLAFGSYDVIIKSPGGCISPTTIVPIKSATNIWDGLAWSNITEPIITENIEFAGDYNSAINLVGTNLSACSCQVNAGVYVDINSMHTLTLTNGLDVSLTGNILFKDKSSLVQINNVTNTGKIEYERKISSSIRPTDYTYWSSPVSGFTLGGIYPNNTTGLFYSYGVISGVEDWQPESAATVMAAGKGYIINGAQPMSGPFPPPSTKPFFGVPNNGDIQVPVTFTNPLNLLSTDPNFGVSYLLGNPYPSALDAETFLDYNTGFLEGTIYFWTHKTQIGIGVAEPGTGVYAYSGADYAAYNSVGGVSVGLGTGSTSGSTPPSGKIASGQGFFATAINTGTVNFTNTMRVGVNGITGNNSQFFKTRSPKTINKNTIQKNRVWLNLTNTQGAFKQILVGYITDATNEYDSRFDGKSFDGNEFVDFYSVNQDKNLVIQGRVLPFDENDEVPLGFRTTINGDFTINIDQVDGLLTNQAVYIEDKLTNTVFDLKSGNYTFNTAAGTFNDRFVLRYIDNSISKTLGISNFDSLKKTVLVSNKNKQIKIYSFSEIIDKVTIYDLLGRQIYQKDKVNSNELSIANLVSSHQALIVKTVLQNGKTVTDKIIF